MADSVDDLLRSAEGWRRGLGDSAPSAEDVEVVVRLRVGDRALLRDLVLDDAAALEQHWDGLRASLAAPAAPAAAAPSPAFEPPALVSDDPEERRRAEGVAAGLDGVELQRFLALSRLVDEQAAAGNELTLRDGALVTVAQQDPDDRNFERRLPGALRPLVPQVVEAVRNAAALAAAAAPTPAPPVPPVPEAPGAAPAPAQTAPVQPAGPRPTGPTATTGFAAFQWSETSEEAAPVEPIRRTVADDGTLVISWPAPLVGAPVQVFRVVTNPTYSPPSPDLGETIAATFDLEAVDTRTPTSSVLHVTVWVNEGVDEAAARAAQPRLHAAGGVVLPVRNCVVRADGGAVVGQWQAMPDVRRFDVERVPAHLVAEHPNYTHTFLLPAEMVSAGGFKDTGAPAGGDFLYRVYALAAVGDAPEELSPPVVREVRIEARVEKVLDLEVTPHEGSNDSYDLTWTMPVTGHVEIYRSESPPASGLDATVRDRFVLQEQRLTEDLRLVQQMVVEGGRGRLLDVPWPSGWARAYFTPVTVISDQIMQVGQAEVLVRVGPVESVRLVERVDEQFLTFAWPQGATVVKIYQGARNVNRVDPDLEQPVFEINEEEYARYGGAHLPKRLPSEGCSVHLVGATFSKAAPVYGPATTLSYSGLCRVWYSLAPVEVTGGFRRGAQPSTKVRLLLKSDIEVTGLPMVVVHHPQRLPLSPLDGQVIHSRDVNMAPNAPVSLLEDFDTSAHEGFVRVFAQPLNEEMASLVAVLDPPLATLRMGG